jgi:hypothetical protein
MSDQKIKCPKCNHEFELSDAFAERFKEKYRAEIEVEAGRRAEETWKVKFESAEQELLKKRGQVKDLEKRELGSLKKMKDLEDREQRLELETQRKLSEERKKISEEASARAAEQHALKEREQKDLIDSLKNQLAEMQRRAEAGSQERQGEALEGELIDLLRRNFPFDEFEEVKKGARGADILQKVRNDLGKLCGSILWETKNTKDFQKIWIEKLQKDRQVAGADLAVLMSVALPPEIDGFGMCRDVWVTNFSLATPLCNALRQTVQKVDREKSVSRHQGTMKDVIYDYITGREFTERVRSIVRAYALMKKDLDSEKRSMTKIWKKREKQIETVLDNMSGMYGEIEGIVGGQKTLLEVELLSLDSITGDDGED